MATLMPCALAVYEDDIGGVRVSKMNVGLLGRVFGGTVGRVMGGLVAREESSILAALETASSRPSATTNSGRPSSSRSPAAIAPACDFFSRSLP